MKLAASNFAWDVPEDEQAARLMRLCGFQGVELAPGKYFPDLCAAPPGEVRALRDWWQEQDLPVIALQGVMYGRSVLNLFSAPADTLHHLSGVVTLARHLEVSRVVFGAPTARDPGDLKAEDAWARARAFFTALAEIASAQGVTIALEAAPSARFLAHTETTWQMVQEVDHPGLGLQFDSGALITTGESGAVTYARVAAHRHLSAPGLLPDLHTEPVQRILGELSAAALDGWLSVETLIPQDGRLDVLDRQLRAATL